METRWYRAPEALCSWNTYTAGIDIWSAGCTFAEMMSGKPLFPGQSTRNQLRLFADMLGTDIVDVLKHIANEKCARFLETLDETPKCDFMEMFPSATEEALEMFFGMVEVDPTKRLTAELSLNCTYLESLHSEDDEPTREPLELSDFEFERRKVDEAALRHELYREMLEFHPELKHLDKEDPEYSVLNCRLLEDFDSIPIKADSGGELNDSFNDSDTDHRQ